VAATPKQRNDDTVPKGDVIGTTPAAGAKVSAKQQITIITSLGPPYVAVPSVGAGTSYDQARRTLKNSAGKFKVNRVDEFNDTVPAGAVISLSPSGRALKFSTITVTVSKGPEMVTVPDIPLGTTTADARKQLAQVNLVPNFQQLGINRPDPVVYDVPSAGQKVRVGSTVVVRVI
jgi:serine/threonine-protein kinase